MVSIFELRKRVIAFQKNRAERIRAKQEEALRKEVEIDKLKAEVRDAQKLRLTPEQKKFREQKILRKAREWVEIRRSVAKSTQELASGTRKLVKGFANLVEGPKRTSTKRKVIKKKPVKRKVIKKKPVKRKVTKKKTTRRKR